MATTESVHTAFLAAQQAFPAINKDASGQVGSRQYRYASLGVILEAVVPVLNKHGLTLSQSTTWQDGTLLLHTVVMHAATGEAIEGFLPLPVPENWQQWGSAMTYARRYSLQAFLGITPDDDDDAGSAQGFRDPGADTRAVERAKTARNEANAAFKQALEANDLMLDADIIRKVAVEAAKFDPKITVNPRAYISTYENSTLHALAKAIMDHPDEIKANLGLTDAD